MRRAPALTRQITGCCVACAMARVRQSSWNVPAEPVHVQVSLVGGRAGQGPLGTKHFSRQAGRTLLPTLPVRCCTHQSCDWTEPARRRTDARCQQAGAAAAAAALPLPAPSAAALHPLRPPLRALQLSAARHCAPSHAPASQNVGEIKWLVDWLVAAWPACPHVMLCAEPRAARQGSELNACLARPRSPPTCDTAGVHPPMARKHMHIMPASRQGRMRLLGVMRRGLLPLLPPAAAVAAGGSSGSGSSGRASAMFESSPRMCGDWLSAPRLKCRCQCAWSATRAGGQGHRAASAQSCRSKRGLNGGYPWQRQRGVS